MCEVGIPVVESKNTKCPFHVFGKMLFPHSRFSRNGQTDLGHFLDHSGRVLKGSEAPAKQPRQQHGGI